MKWLHEHGMVSCLRDYLELPMPALEAARLLMEAEAVQSQKEFDAAKRVARSGVSSGHHR